MNYICTWLCADQTGEESRFPQTGQLSSSQSHQEIYWRCLILFFITSKRFNRTEGHILFTNVKELPFVDGREVAQVLRDLQVTVVHTGFAYKTPKGYFDSFQNQFYEFSILEKISHSTTNKDDLYLILDSDCIFIKPAAPLFQAAKPNGFISFKDDVAPDYVINGLSRSDLKSLYTELLHKPVQEMPDYHLGEFLLASADNIRQFYGDFRTLWPELLQRHAMGLKKFNEEAHTLSYLYFINGFRAEPANHFMKRIWTNPLFYRNVEESDRNLAIWHLPAEKTFGLRRLYDMMIRERGFGDWITNEDFVQLAEQALGIPHLSWQMRLHYYTVSLYRALNKRITRKIKPPQQKISPKQVPI